MALKDDMKELNDALKGRKQNLADIDKLEAKGYKSAVDRKKVEEDIFKIQQNINNLKADSVSLGKQINKLGSVQGTDLDKILGITKSINLAKEAQKSGDKEAIRQSKFSLDLKKRILRGEADEETILREKSKLTGKYLEDIEAIEETLSKTPNLSEKLKLEAQAQDRIDNFRDKISETSALLSSKKAMGVAAIGAAVKLMTDFANKALEVRQSLGTSAVDSARLAGNIKVAGLAAKAVGGNSQEAEAAVLSIAEEFGSISNISLGVSKQLGVVTGQFGLSGANAGKLLKSLQSINGASLETNLNLISATGELARAEGVAPAQVLNDIAGDTENFAKFAKDGGRNIAAAAIEARKLGLALGTVAGIAENLLDFESSIEAQLEASLLLGRQINLDKARELALTGDLEGLAKEVKNQVGSQAEFEAMNVMQRQSLAKAIGVSVADLGKIVAGEQTAAELAEEQAKATKKNADLTRTLVGLQTAAAMATAIASFSGIPLGLGVFAGIAAAGIIASTIKNAPKAQTGGVVQETGVAVVHKGETISGTAGQFGNETNKLLRELISQNEILMGRLTNKVGDLALS